MEYEVGQLSIQTLSNVKVKFYTCFIVIGHA